MKWLLIGGMCALALIAGGIALLAVLDTPPDPVEARGEIDAHLVRAAKQEGYLLRRITADAPPAGESGTSLAQRCRLYRTELKETRRLLARPGWPDAPAFRDYWQAAMDLIVYKLELCDEQVVERLAASDLLAARRRLLDEEARRRQSMLLELLRKADEKLDASAAATAEPTDPGSPP